MKGATEVTPHFPLNNTHNLRINGDAFFRRRLAVVGVVFAQLHFDADLHGLSCFGG